MRWPRRHHEARTLVLIADASADAARLATDLVDGVAQLAWPRTSVIAIGPAVAATIFDCIAAELGASSQVVRQTWAGRAGVLVAEDAEHAVRLALALDPLTVGLRVADPEPLHALFIQLSDTAEAGRLRLQRRRGTL